jgi:predicted nucleotidyltransferase component of viral defense system
MISAKNDFLLLVEKAMQTPGCYHMRPVIEKELLHYDILFALDNAGLLDNLTFQGGTALRLCYGALRFSEGLDFAGGIEFKMQDLIPIKRRIEEYLGKRYGLEVTVREPQEMLQEPENRNIKVSKWQIRIVTHPEQRDLPKQVIKIEVANIPAYTRQPLALKQNYDFLPDGYPDTLVMVETLDEIVADKVIAFVNCQAYVRYRDVWDLYWLKQQGAVLNKEFFIQKLNDYKIENYPVKVKEMLTRLPDIIYGGELRAQLSRFIPVTIQERTLLKDKFYVFLENETRAILEALL